MNIKSLLSSFRRRLLWEALARTFLFSLTAGAAAVFLVSFGGHIALTEPRAGLLWIVFGGVFAAAFVLIFFLGMRPTEKKVAQRIDQIGLQERVGTMLEYRDDTTEIARLQRTDAVYHIGRVLPEQMPWNFRKKEFVLCLVSVCLAVVMLILPYDFRLFGVTVSANAGEQAQIVRDLIEELRENIRQAELEKEQKEALEELIRELEEELREEAASQLEQAAEMQEAARDLQEMLEEGITRDEIGEALQKNEMTEKLGEAISSGDSEAVSEALDELENALNEDPSQTGELADALRRALEEAGTDAEDPLHSALEEFASDLEKIEEQELEGEAFSGELGEAFGEAEEAIQSALERQAALEEEIGRMQDALERAKDEILGNEPGEQPAEGEGEGEMPSGGIPQSGIPQGGMPGGDMSQDGMGDGTGSGEADGEDSYDRMTEPIYDPYSGSVAYGEVFASYYAEYLDALESGDVPQELQDIMDSYFDALNEG